MKNHYIKKSEPTSRIPEWVYIASIMIGIFIGLCILDYLGVIKVA